MQFFHHRIIEWGYFFVLYFIYDLSIRILYHADNIHSPTNHYILCIGTHLPTEQIGVQHHKSDNKHKFVLL